MRDPADLRAMQRRNATQTFLAYPGRMPRQVLLCIALFAACGEDDDCCDFGQLDRCEERSGGLRYCERDGTWSECVAYVECNPLTQEGCDNGLASAHDGRDGYILDAPECEPGEKCGRIDVLPEGVGKCGDFDVGD
jgi:hypothetical protein